MLTTLITLFIVGFLGLIALSVVLAIVGTLFSVAFGIAGFLLFKIAPILLVGWIILKVVERAGNRRDISPADQRWLDG